MCSFSITQLPCPVEWTSLNGQDMSKVRWVSVAVAAIWWLVLGWAMGSLRFSLGMVSCLTLASFSCMPVCLWTWLLPGLDREYPILYYPRLANCWLAFCPSQSFSAVTDSCFTTKVSSVLVVKLLPFLKGLTAMLARRNPWQLPPGNEHVMFFT